MRYFDSEAEFVDFSERLAGRLGGEFGESDSVYFPPVENPDVADDPPARKSWLAWPTWTRSTATSARGPRSR
jgi:hypothetical protein